MKRCILLIILAIILIQTTQGILLSPPSYELEFKPNLEQDCGFAVKNTASSPLDFWIYVTGDLNESIKPKEDSMRINPEIWYNVPCTIKLPEDIPPGLHENKVIIMEGSKKANMVGAVAGVGLLVYIRKPYPGKYLDAGLQVSDTPVNTPAELKLTLTSRGTETINSAKTTFNIYHPSGKLLKTIQGEPIQILPSTTREITTTWQHSEAGTYKAVAEVDYDGTKIKAEKEFKLGDLVVLITNVTAEDTTIGTIAKVKVKLQSFWNSNIDKAYASLEVKDEKGTTVTTSDSPSVTLTPWDAREMLLYFDTTGMQPGRYSLITTLHYADKTASMTGSINLLKPFPLLLVVGASILVLIILIILYLKFRKKEEKKESQDISRKEKLTSTKRKTNGKR